MNLTGTFLVCQAALPHLLDGGGVDRQHRVERRHQVAAVLGRVLRVEGGRRAPHPLPRRRVLEAQGVRVNCVAPGGIETPLQEAFMEFPEGVDWKRMRKVMSPLGNSTPEEIAKVVAFIASDDCRYMTGSIVSIDGGITV